jgi:hypothetical protein
MKQIPDHILLTGQAELDYLYSLEILPENLGPELEFRRSIRARWKKYLLNLADYQRCVLFSYSDKDLYIY